MKKQSFLKIPSILFFTIIIVMASCNNGASDKSSDKKAANDSSNTTSPAQAVAMQAMPASPSGKLDMLWVADSLFVKLESNEKVVLSFTFGQADTLTLHGWSAKNSPKQFTDTPNIRLLKGIASLSFTYGVGTYFGDVILSQQDVKSIQTALKPIDPNKVKYVLFNPFDPNDPLPKQLKHIYYQIYIVDVEPTAANFDKIKLVTVAATANPSPPKNF